MVEVQALTTDAMLGTAKRKVSGADADRVAMIIAVLEKRAGLRLVDKDVFVNVVGGIRLSDPSADAAIALAIASAHMNRPLPPSTHRARRTGPPRRIPHRRPDPTTPPEAERLGFAHAIIPARTKLPPRSPNGVGGGGGMQHHPCRRIDQAIELLG